MDPPEGLQHKSCPQIEWNHRWSWAGRKSPLRPQQITTRCKQDKTAYITHLPQRSKTSYWIKESLVRVVNYNLLIDCLCSLMLRNFCNCRPFALKIKITLPRPKWRAIEKEIRVLRDRWLTKSSKRMTDYAFSVKLLVVARSSGKAGSGTLKIRPALGEFDFASEEWLMTLGAFISYSKLTTKKYSNFNHRLHRIGVSWPCNGKIT